jgi:signal transduction histidine kinase
MLRRRFLSLFCGAAVGSPLATNAKQTDHGRLLDQIDELAEARREKTELLSRISEMRQPLTIMLGYTELILDDGCGEASAEVRTALQSVRRGGYRAVELINAVFDAARMKRSD